MVVHIITTLQVGGAERVVLNLAKNHQRKFRPFIFCLTDMDDVFRTDIPNGVGLRIMQMNKNPISLIRTILALLDEVKQHNARLLHCHMYHACIIAMLAKLFCWKLQIVFTPHSTNLRSVLRHLLVRLTSCLRRRDICFSEDSIPWFIGKKKVEIIPNSISVPEINENKFKKSPVFTFINVASLTEHKNQTTLIHGFKCAFPNDSCRLLILGEGPKRKELEWQIELLGLQERVSLPGCYSNEEIYKILYQSHVFVLSSLWEGLPISLLEAIYCKLPVLVPPVGAIRQVVPEGLGFLTEPSDITDAMVAIKRNYPLALENATVLHRKVISQFSNETFIEKHAKVYREILLT